MLHRRVKGRSAVALEEESEGALRTAEKSVKTKLRIVIEFNLIKAQSQRHGETGARPEFPRSERNDDALDVAELVTIRAGRLHHLLPH